MRAKTTERKLSRKQLERDLAELADPERAANLAWFFKTGKGEYGEGDRFLGIRVPLQRRMAKRYTSLSLREIERLLASPIHEHRFTALEILVAKYERAPEPDRAAIFLFYLQHTGRINSWDLVDTSAPYIVGEHLRHRNCDLLDQLAASPLIWDRRIAIVSTLTFIKHAEIETTFHIARQLLQDKHDLIQKAVGWALREAGTVSRAKLLSFLKEHYNSIPRTTLRYAIEHFPVDQRKLLLAGTFTHESL